MYLPLFEWVCCKMFWTLLGYTVIARACLSPWNWTVFPHERVGSGDEIINHHAKQLTLDRSRLQHRQEHIVSIILWGKSKTLSTVLKARVTPWAKLLPSHWSLRSGVTPPGVEWLPTLYMFRYSLLPCLQLIVGRSTITTHALTKCNKGATF